MPKNSSVATWNLRRLGQGNWGESSWLKLRMLTRIATDRRWKKSGIGVGCMLNGSGVFAFKGVGGSWISCFQQALRDFVGPGMAPLG